MPNLSKRAAALKRLRTKADAHWQQCVKLEHPQCEVCGKPTRVGHHFFTKGSSSELRYDLRNGIGLCNGCHFKHHKGDPAIHYTILKSKRSYGWYSQLAERRAVRRKRNTEYYEGAIEELAARLAELEGR